MRREIVIMSILWLAACIILPLFIIPYSLNIAVTWELIQLGAFASLLGINAFYLFYVFYKISERAGVVFIIIWTVGFWLTRVVYNRFFPDIDTRVQLLQILAFLIATTLVVLLLRRKPTLR